MKKIITILCLLFISSVLAQSQAFTTVTATVQDPSGQAWGNVVVTATLLAPPNIAGPLLNQGHTIIDSPQTVVGDNLGNFGLTVDDNTKIIPAGSQWRFNICPNTSSPCATLTMTIGGTSVDISGQVNGIITNPTIQVTTTVQKAYNTNEAVGGNGSLFWRTTDNTLWGCQTTPLGICPTGWTMIGSGGGGGGSGNMNWRGTWNAGINYAVNDVVFYNFTGWVALVSTIGSTPSQTNTNWQAFNKVGSNQQVLFNDNGLWNGDGGLMYDKATGNLTILGQLLANSISLSGTAPYKVTGVEGTCSLGVAASDQLCSDSATHHWVSNNNNGGTQPLPTITGGTSGHKVYLASNGIDFTDGGLLFVGCGSTSTCAGTSVPTVRFIGGTAPLVSGTPSTVTITGISPAFTSNVTYHCTAGNETNATRTAVQFSYVSGSSFTITGPNTVTDVISYICWGT